MSISISNLTKTFGTQKALDDVSFSVGAGEVVGFLGPNGAGKTTMMKIITCFIPPDTGQVTVCGFDFYDHPLEIRKRVGYLPENNPLYPDLYVKEYLEFVAGIYKIPFRKKRIEEIIAITGLQPEQHKKIGALSKGYRQRVGLAQALIHNPEVLILDEPTSGLDPNQLVDIRNMIREIGRQKTVMLSTHIMQEVEAICDRAIIIDKGKIVADDLTRNLSARSTGFQKLKIEFSKDVSGEMLAGIPEIKTKTRISNRIWEIETDKGDIREKVFQFAVNNGLAVLSMEQSGKGLEETFQRLTRDK
jgi:ABC-2 type transport system ATP-binding protein